MRPTGCFLGQLSDIIEISKGYMFYDGGIMKNRVKKIKRISALFITLFLSFSLHSMDKQIFGFLRKKGTPYESTRMFGFFEDEVVKRDDVGGGFLVRKKIKKFNKLGPMRTFSFLRDGKRLIFLTDKSIIHIANFPQKKNMNTQKKLAIPEKALFLFSPDGQHYAIVEGVNNNKIIIKNIGTNKKVKECKLNGIRSISFSPDGKYLGAVRPGIIRVWDMRSGKRILNLMIADTSVKDISLSNDATYIAVAAGNITVDLKIWKKTGEFFKEIKTDHLFFPAIALQPDGEQIAVVGEKEVGFFNVQTGKVISRRTLKKVVQIAAKPPIIKEKKDFDELGRRKYVQQELQDEDSDVILPEMKAKIRIHGKDEFYIPRFSI